MVVAGADTRLSAVRTGAPVQIELPPFEQRAALIERVKRMLREAGREPLPPPVLDRLAKETFP